MFIRWLKIALALILSLIFTISLTKVVISVWENFNFGTSERYDVELWLEQHQLHHYKETFRKRGEYFGLLHVFNDFLYSIIQFQSPMCALTTDDVIELISKLLILYLVIRDTHPFRSNIIRYDIPHDYEHRDAQRWNMIFNLFIAYIYCHTKPPVFIP